MRASTSLSSLLIGAISLATLGHARAQDDAGVVVEVPSEPAVEVPEVADTDVDVEPGGPTPEQAALLESVHVTELAQTTRATLREARPLLREESDVLRIARELPAQEADIARLTSPARRAQIGQMSQRELADFRQDWRGLHDRYQAWQDTLAARGAALETARTQLVELRRTWRALRDAAEADTDADASGRDTRIERITHSLVQVRAVADALDERRDTVQALEDRVTELLIATDEVSDAIRDALAAYREHLLERDRAPIWQGLGPDVVEADELPWPDNVRAQAVLFTELRPAVARLLGLVVLCALVLEALRRRTRWTEDEDVPLARAIIAKPIAVASVLGLIGSRFVVSHAPVLFDDAASVVLLAPVLWLVWSLVPAAMRPVVGLVAAYAVVDRIEGTMPDGSTPRRILVLVEAAAVAAGLVVWITRARSERGRLVGASRVLASLAAIVLVAGLAANVLGYVFLATVLVRGTAVALWGALTLGTAFVILDALAVVVAMEPLLERLHGVRVHRALLLSRARRALVLALSLAWCVLVLGAYGVASPFFSWASDALDAHGSFGTLDLSLGEVLAAVLVLAASWLVTRSVLFVLELDVLPRLSLEPGVDGAIAGLSRYVLFGTGLILALGTLGIDASQIALVAGALGVGVGFGLQGIVANFIAGIVLMLERPVRLGDRIEVGALAGRVERIGLRSSTVRGDDGAEVIVPNEALISREVVNWTLSDRKRRVQIAVGVAYGTDPRQVLDVVTRAVMGHPEVLTKAKGAADPAVHFTAFGPSSLDFVVEFWAIANDEANRLKGEVGVRVLDALAAAKIEIPFPQQDVRVVSLPAPAKP